MRVSFDQMNNYFYEILLKHGFSDARAQLCAKLFAEASLDGFHSHGLNRFPRFVRDIVRGNIDPSAQPKFAGKFGVLERWDGCSGPGNLNAHFSMNRAITLAKDHGIGCVALSNTNHWMRAGSYGWQAADAECVGVCWTNTLPNTPPWGSKEVKVGNNPIVFAIPRADGHLVLDMAMSQFSYGQLYLHRSAGKLLSVEGGYDEEGNPSRDPAAILESKRLLPLGYWKGSGMIIMLDLIAALLSGGQTTYEIGQSPGERNISQVFMAINTEEFPDQAAWGERLEDMLADLHSAEAVDSTASTRYPGEDTLHRRRKHLREGIPVDEEIWQQVLDLK